MMLAASASTAGLPRATFVGSTVQTISRADSVVLNLAGIAGLQDLDYVMVWATNAGYAYPSMPAAWQQDNYTWTPAYGYRESVFHRQLPVGGAASHPSIDTSGSTDLFIAAWRGASRAVRQVISYDDDGNSSQVVPGFNRAWDCVGVLCGLFDRDTGSNTFTVGSGWTKRFNTDGAFFRMSVADALGTSDYVDGASLTWGSLGTTGPYAQVAQMYELRI